jgi:hypothetical protein
MLRLADRTATRAISEWSNKNFAGNGPGFQVPAPYRVGTESRCQNQNRDQFSQPHEAERFPMKSRVMSLHQFGSAVKNVALTLATVLLVTLVIASQPVTAAAQSTELQELLDAQARQRQALNDTFNQLRERVIENSSDPDQMRTIYDQTETPDLIQQELDNQMQALGDISRLNAEREAEVEREAERNRDRQWSPPDPASEGSSDCTNSDGSTIAGSESWSACPAN